MTNSHNTTSQHLAIRPLSWLLNACALAALTLTAGCGGGGGSNTASNGVGLGGTGVATGPVTGFGSIIVNGVRFEDSAADVVDDSGTKLSRSDIKLGMVVDVVSGPITDDSSTQLKKASATRIEYGSSIKGVVTAKGATTLTVMGQTINVPSTTVFDGFANGLSDVSTLSPNHLVEVHALLNPSNGQFEATRIEREASLNECKLIGIVNGLNTNAKTFNLGGYAIAYTNADARVTPSDGSRVKVRLTFNAGNCTNTATRIDSASTALTESASAEIEGYVTDFVNGSPVTFKVNGVSVQASAVPSGTTNGSRVEAEGLVQNGVLVASKVERKDVSNSESVRLYGTPSSVNTATDRLIINNVTVSYASATLEDGLIESALSSTSLEVRGALDATGTVVVATRIKPKN